MRYPYTAAITAALLTSNALAAVNNPQDDNPLETVTVSATPVQVDDAGSSVSIITREDIEKRNAANLTSLLREVPGFAVSQQGSEGAVSQVRVRGAEANQVLVLINGIEANDIAQGSEFDFSQVAVTDIERIEIVRGPQSALWGSDATAGVIHIITRPQAIETGFNTGIETGSFGTRRVNLAARYGSKNNRIKFTADYLDSEGSNISRIGGEEDGQRNLTLGLTGSYEISDDLSIRYTARSTDRTTEFDGTDFLTTGLPADAENRTESAYLYAGVSIHHAVNNWLDHTLSFNRTDTDNETAENGLDAGSSRGTKDALRYQVNMQYGPSRLSVLLEHEQEDFHQRGTASFFGDPNQDRETETDSVAFEYRFEADRFNLSFSARQDSNSAFDDATSWRATGNLEAWGMTLYASVGESIKNPTFAERFGYFTNFVGNPDLKPERSLQWETGVRGNYLEDRLGVSATYFNADLKDEINGFVFDSSTFAFTARNSDGASDRQGIELALSYEIASRFDLRATYTYLDATQEDQQGDDITEVRRPKHSGSVRLSYTGERTGATFGVAYTGDQEDDYFPPFPPYFSRVDLPGFTLVDLSAYHRLSDHVTLTARLENATDRDYEQVYGFESPGFGGYLGVRLRW